MEDKNISKHSATSDQELGRVQLGGEGVGSPTRGQVAERALEIAEIEGRPGNPSPDDYTRARSEVRGVIDEDNGTKFDRVDNGEARDLAEVHGDSAGPVSNLEAPDESNDLNKLVHEGVDEANHEQMLEARREKDENALQEDETEGDLR